MDRLKNWFSQRREKKSPKKYQQIKTKKSKNKKNQNNHDSEDMWVIFGLVGGLIEGLGEAFEDIGDILDDD